MLEIDETHDPALTSWVKDADREGTPFPIQNLPLGIFSPSQGEPVGEPRVGVAIGDYVLDLRAAHAAGLLGERAAHAASLCGGHSLNALMATDAEQSSTLRLALSRLLRTGSPNASAAWKCMYPSDQVLMHLPADIRNFTDFYTSIDHANNASRLMRPNGLLASCFKHLPIAYHGRASSVSVSGTECIRPMGQMRSAGGEPMFSPTAKLDFEAEVGFFVRRGNRLGQRITMADAEAHVFGLCLVNDWSARDIQSWEAQPLGPFLGKSFLTSVSPWVVTLEALAPFRVPAAERDPVDPKLQAHLDDSMLRLRGGIAIELIVSIETPASRRLRRAGVPVTHADFSGQYWTIFQMLSHHSSNGCNLLPGDLLASGTVSGAVSGTAGCLFEATRNGATPVQVSDNEYRSFLEDGDEVSIQGFCRRDGARPIGFGECRGKVIPSVQMS